VEKRESKVKDLAEKLQRGELTPKEALRKLKERGLTEKEAWEIIPWMIYLILCLLPLAARQSGLDSLAFFAQLPAIRFPATAIYISVVLVAIGTFFLIWQIQSHRKRGGLKADETIILYKVGLYRIMRHPGGFGFMMWPFLLPIILSEVVPFTFLSIAALIVMIIYFYVGVRMEEKLDVEKWGDEYIQYMKEVPRFNLVKGLWNLRKRAK